MEITQQAVQGRQIIQSYGDGGFRIAGVRHEGSVLVFARRTMAWAVTSAEGLAVTHFRQLAEMPGEVDVLLVGMGRTSTVPARELRAALRELGITVETMTTSAACRTFNVLLAEERKIATALVAVL